MALSEDQWLALEPSLRPADRTAFEALVEELGARPEHLADLALARAAAGGHPEATAQLERLVRATRPFVARLHGDPSFLDDVHQLVMGRLLLGPRPRVLDYAGLGPLGAWLRALAVRLALDERRRVPREQPADDVSVFLAAHVTRAEPHRALTAQRVSAAIRRALEALPPRDRALLRLHHLEGLTLEALAQSYGVHRASVARWLADARALVLAQTRHELTSTVGGDELAEALDSVQSLLDVSFGRLFEP